jgi:hypothetical protein
MHSLTVQKKLKLCAGSKVSRGQYFQDFRATPLSFVAPYSKMVNHYQTNRNRFHAKNSGKTSQRHNRSASTLHKLRLQQLMSPMPSYKMSLTQRKQATKPVTRYVTVYDEPFKVLLPRQIPLYEGLRRWYPKLYEMATLEDEELNYDEMPLHGEEEDDEGFTYWDRLEYMEWMYD